MTAYLTLSTTSHFPLSYPKHSSIHSPNMGFLKKLSSKKPNPAFRMATQEVKPELIRSSVITPTPRNTPSRLQSNPRQQGEEAPPAYTPRPPAQHTVVATPTSNAATADSPYAFLRQFDTIFLIDDSGSMAGRSWRETSAALAAITPICTAQDSDGIDIFFLNHRNPTATDHLGGYSNVTTTAAVDTIFRSVRPLGGTPTGTRLNQILKPYLAEVAASVQRHGNGQESEVKPLNIIVVTDGVASDDVESVIVNAGKKLDQLGAEPWQVGIQFFQVGQEPEAAEDLQELDDALAGAHGIRDMVDTVPWNGQDGSVLTAEGIMKVTMGAINRKLDRRRGSDERLRR